jgi:hypothetical protein
VDHQKAIRDAAETLRAATVAARAAGYRVSLQLSAIERIEVSETAAVKRPEPAPVRSTKAPKAANPA